MPPPDPRPDRTPPGASACLEIHALPWRRRSRFVDLGPLGDLPSLSDDLLGPVLSIAYLVLGVLVAVVVVGSLVLVLLELWLLLALAVLLVVARFAGLVPWVVDPATGGSRERYRWLPHAVRRVRERNGGGPVRIRWSWVG